MSPELDPSAGTADYTLFNRHLRNRDMDAAHSTLVALQKDHAGARTDACVVRFQCKTSEKEKALAGLRRLCFASSADSTALEEAASAVTRARWGRDAERLFNGLLTEPGVNPQVGALWVKRFASRQAWNHRRRLRELDPATPLGNKARCAFISATGQYKKPEYLRSFIKGEKETLQKDPQCWGQIGYALVLNKLYLDAVGWMPDWKLRKNIEPWMLSNLVLAQRALGNDSEAGEISLHALSLPADQTTHQHQLWVACDEAIAGNMDSAGARLALVPQDELPDFYKALYLLTDAVVSVQTAPEDRRQIIFENRRQTLRQPAHQTSFRADSLRGLAKSGVKAMAKAAHTRSFRLGGSKVSPLPARHLNYFLPVLTGGALMIILLWVCVHMWDTTSSPIPTVGTKPVVQASPSVVKAPVPEALSSFSREAVTVDFRDSQGKPIEFKIDQETAPVASPTP